MTFCFYVKRIDSIVTFFQKKDPTTASRPVTKSYFETKFKSVLMKYPELDVKLAPQKLVPHSVIVSKKEELGKKIDCFQLLLVFSYFKCVN